LVRSASKENQMFIRAAIVGVAGLTLAACTSTGNVERNAAGGAALGALAGAVIGNNVGEGDAQTGALAGAAIGGAAGAYRGYRQDQDAEEGPGFADDQNYAANREQPRYYDRGADRYYYVDPRTSRTYWENGAYRNK
jgi:phage tail tape-measure protein